MEWELDSNPATGSRMNHLSSVNENHKEVEENNGQLASRVGLP